MLSCNPSSAAGLFRLFPVLKRPFQDPRFIDPAELLFCGAALYRCLCIEKRLNIMEEAFNARLGRHEERLKTEPVGKIFSNGTTLWEDIQNLLHPEDNWGNWR